MYPIKSEGKVSQSVRAAKKRSCTACLQIKHEESQEDL